MIVVVVVVAWWCWWKCKQTARARFQAEKKQKPGECEDQQRVCVRRICVCGGGRRLGLACAVGSECVYS